MKRLSSQQVATKIEPGQDADTSIVLIERPIAGFRDRVRGGLTLDNSGSEALGRGQLSTYLALDNPLGLNDIFNLSGNINAQHPSGDHRTLGVSSSYSIPWKYSTLNLSLSSSRFAQFVQGTTARFLSSGSSSTAEAKWNYIAWRSASAKAGVYAGISTRRAESFLDDVELVVQRRRTSTFESGVTLKQFIGQGSLDLDLAYRMGVTWGSAQEDYPSAANGGLTIRPRILSFNFALNEPFTLAKRAYQYNASLRGQHTRNTTLSIDQFSIGNRSSVRGFDSDSVLLAESGFALRNEISTVLPTYIGVDSSLFVGLDFGAVSGASAKNLVGKKLAGLAVGTRGRWKEFQFDFTLATPLSKPEKFRSRTVNPYVSLTYSR